MRKPPKAPPSVLVGIFTLITILIWGGIEISKAFTSKPQTNIPPEVLEPINPALDQDALTKIQNRIRVSDEEIGLFATNSSIPATPTPTAPPATESAQEATSSGGTSP